MSDLLTWIALRRVHSGGVANVAGCWIDGSYRVPCYLPPVLNELTDARLVVLADDGPHGPLRRASLTETGQARYATLREQHGARDVRAELEAPAQATQTPTGRRSSAAPPAPHNGRSGPSLRWARDQYDGRLHALASVDVLLAETRGYAECRCEHRLPADIDLEAGPSGALCLPCVVGVAADVPDPAC